MKPGLALLGGLALGVAAHAAAWPLSFGAATGNRVAPGGGTFPRWQASALATEAPLRWLVALPPRRIAAVDREGTLWVFEVLTPAGLRIAGRWGAVGSPEGPPAVIRLGQEQTGLALVGVDGRLLAWSEGVLRGYDVGTPLSRLTFPVPVALAGRAADDLLAVAQDGAVLLVSGLGAGGPRVISRVEVQALPDARITLGDLGGDGVPEAVVLSNPTDRYPHGILGDRLEAAGLTVIAVQPWSLEVRGRLALPAPAVFEDLVPVVALIGGPRPAVLLSRSAPGQGAAVVALGWRDGRLAVLAESPALGQTHRWTHVIGAADLSGDGTVEIAAVTTPHLGGVLTAYRWAGGALARVARLPGYSSHVAGSRNQDKALIADLDGNGRPEVVLPRQSREIVAGVELHGDRWVERWSVELKSAVGSNLVAADLDGDGLLDLAVADRRGLYLLLSAR